MTPFVPAPEPPQAVTRTVPAPASDADVALPIMGYAERRTVKSFGEEIRDRFSGYHVADDVEYTDDQSEVPVLAIADGTVTFAGRSSGYGGLMVIAHEVNGEQISAIYGHLDAATMTATTGDRVTRGQIIARLGEGGTTETDGERKHLHFGLYPGTSLRKAGYVPRAADVSDWINPQDFFAQHGIALAPGERSLDTSREPGGDIYRLAFTVPAGWEVEYVPGLQALNLFRIAGSGVARERSQMFIRYFDADRFLTLSTVNVLRTEELRIGLGSYEARRYEIEKNAGVPDFPGQPAWRNRRHTVTDFRAGPGRTRYYVVAASPDLDSAIYERVLGSMMILE